jgi:hypothetical protein
LAFFDQIFQLKHLWMRMTFFCYWIIAILLISSLLAYKPALKPRVRSWAALKDGSFKVFTSDFLEKIEQQDETRAFLTLDPDTPSPLQSSFSLSDKEVISFMQLGHLFAGKMLRADLINDRLSDELNSIFQADRIEAYRHELLVTGSATEEEIAALSVDQLQERMTSDAFPFMQLFNLWRKSSIVRSLALHPDLGRIASQLLGVDSVRLYQDSLFVKQPGNGATQWHSDLNMSPFDSNLMVTCW